MDVDTLTAELNQTFALSGTELIYRGLLALIQKEMHFVL